MLSTCARFNRGSLLYNENCISEKKLYPECSTSLKNRELIGILAQKVCDLREQLKKNVTLSDILF
jgi:hypothetical protein